jgi:hypothetical protein
MRFFLWLFLWLFRWLSTWLFVPRHGRALYESLAGAIAFSIVVLAVLSAAPNSIRKYTIRAVTLLAGAFFACEFLYPVHSMPTGADPAHRGNFLTPYVFTVTTFALIVSAWTVGLGLLNLAQLHGKRLIRGGENAIYSAAFFFGLISVGIIGLLQKPHANAINKNLYTLLYTGALQNLDATVFSIIAFYIVSAAYRAFRVRSIEATLLLATAIVVMLGQTSIGQVMTSHFPTAMHTEVIRDWIMSQPNAAAVRAINFGLAVGSLAVALRVWLGLERGSFFDSQ